MQEYEINAHIDQWKQKEKREDERAAFLAAAIGNFVYGSQGVKTRFTAEDFLESKQPVKPKTADQLRSLAILAFGPPPKTN